MATDAQRAVWAAMTEAEFLQNVIEQAVAGGHLYYHVYDSKRSPSGFPDLVIPAGGTLYIKELKTEKGRPSAKQREWLAALSGCYHVEAGIWRPSNIGEIERKIGPKTR